MDVNEIFGGGALTSDEFEQRLLDTGMTLSNSAEISRLNSELESEKNRHEEEIMRIKAESALKYELYRAGAQNPEVAAAAIGLGELSQNTDELSSRMRERVAAFKRAEPYMFRTADDPVKLYSTGGAHTGACIETDTMSDAEYYSYVERRGH